MKNEKNTKQKNRKKKKKSDKKDTKGKTRLRRKSAAGIQGRGGPEPPLVKAASEGPRGTSQGRHLDPYTFHP
ncbi:hypothetical protein E2C01_098289 [Portunus trituberculatus]|uniref:Uncharacterized protein n=1 Tax=Portunus trituberculatus TaxID=210409 RepID=A0A5B7K2M8_PORTR|nr:hypothetical protein [Portunus trituberculatus]